LNIDGWKITNRSLQELRTKNEGGGKLAGERFEIFKDTVGKFRFRLRAQNGEIIAESGAYDSKEGCQTGIASVKENAAKAVIKDFTT
jgi:uncharacterized protein YegP (UPF0339 family)